MVTAIETETLPMSRSLAELREEHGLSIDELAQQVGVSDQSIRLWEAGLVRPRPRAYAQLLSILQVSEDEITLTPYANEGEVLEARRRAGRRRWEKHREKEQEKAAG